MSDYKEDVANSNKRREAFEARKQKIEELKQSGNETEASKESDKLHDDQSNFYFEGILRRDAHYGGSAEIPMVIRKSKSVISELSDGDVTADDVRNFNSFITGLSSRATELDGKISILRKLDNKKSRTMLADLMLKKQYIRRVRKIVSDKGHRYITKDRIQDAAELTAKQKAQEQAKAKAVETGKDDFAATMDNVLNDYMNAKGRSRGFYNAPMVAGVSLDNAKTSRSAAQARLKELMAKTRNSKKPSRTKVFTADRAKNLLLQNKMLQSQGARG